MIRILISKLFDTSIPSSNLLCPRSPLSAPRDADAALRDAGEERTAYVTMLEEARGAIAQLQEELCDARCEGEILYL